MREIEGKKVRRIRCDQRRYALQHNISQTQRLMSDNEYLQHKSAQQRLSEKESKWAIAVQEVALASPPGTRAIIVTRLIGAGAYVVMIPLHPEWFVYALWAVVIVVSDWRLARLARREFRSPKGTVDAGNAGQNS